MTIFVFGIFIGTLWTAWFFATIQFNLPFILFFTVHVIILTVGGVIAYKIDKKLKELPLDKS